MVFFPMQGLKSHAVTMFEVGKLTDESLDSFLGELEKVRSDCSTCLEMFLLNKWIMSSRFLLHDRTESIANNLIVLV